MIVLCWFRLISGIITIDTRVGLKNMLKIIGKQLDVMRIPKFSCHGCQTSLSTYLLISGLCNLFFFLKYRILRTLTNVMSSCLAAWVKYSSLRRCPIHEYASPRWSEDFCCVYYIFHCLLCSKCFTVFQQFTEKGTY